MLMDACHFVQIFLMHDVAAVLAIFPVLQEHDIFFNVEVQLYCQGTLLFES